MRQATIRFFRPICSSIRMDHFVSKWKDFHESYAYWTVHHLDI